MMLAVIDSGVANLTSVLASLKRLDIDAVVTSDPATIGSADRVILPGVGAAGPAMAKLRAKNLIEVIRGLKQPVLGVCLGMQLLFTQSSENDVVPCLDVIKGQITALPSADEMPIPHMGWNQIKISTQGHPLLKNIDDFSFVYFVHSYAAPLGVYTLASCDYSQSFTAIAGHRNFYGCQFHPERSSSVGSQILKNFLEL